MVLDDYKVSALQKKKVKLQDRLAEKLNIRMEVKRQVRTKKHLVRGGAVEFFQRLNKIQRFQ